MSQKLNGIRDKYRANLTQIKEYIRYIESYFLSTIKMNAHLDEVSPTFFENQTIDNICTNLVQIRAEMITHSNSLQSEIDSIQILEDVDDQTTLRDSTPDGDVLLYLVSEIHKGNSDKDKLFSDVMSFLEVMCITKGDLIGGGRFHELYDQPKYVKRLIDIAFNDENIRKYSSLQKEILQISNSIKALDLFDSTNHMNIYRQSFIQEMAFFDSCVFEIAKICMEDNFFDWLLVFANKNLKTHDIAKYSSFDDFQSAYIQETLKACYVKDIIHILHDKDKAIFELNGQDIYSEIREAINRRNVHIHHNGEADEMYIGEFNVFSASLG